MFGGDSPDVGDLDFVVGRIDVDDPAVAAHFQTVRGGALEHRMSRQLAQHRFDTLERSKRFAAANTLVGLRLVQHACVFALRREQQPRLQRDGVFRAGRGAQSTLDAVFLDELELRLVGVVL